MSLDPGDGAGPAEPVAFSCARSVVAGLIDGGVRDVVLAPGSRSAPLAYVLHGADLAGRIRLHVRIDERTAGFLALGLAKASGRPAGVVTTSGTAAANLHPAVLEASAAGIPLIAVTADRPAALRHSGANQTTDQLRLFGAHVRGFAALEDSWTLTSGWRNEVARLTALAVGARSRDPGPVQLNISLSEPLVPGVAMQAASAAVPTAAPVLPVASPAGEHDVPGIDPMPVLLPPGPRTVVVAGDAPPELGQAIARSCATAGVPLFAEPSSNARRGSAALATYRILLASGMASEIERVVVVGRPTLSRPVNELLGRSDVELLVVSERASWPDPALRRPLVVEAVTFEPDGTDWLGRWQAADRQVAASLADLLSGRGVSTGPGLARTVLASVPPGLPVVLGSSSPIRDADLAPIRDQLGPVFAHRGLAGIDGTTSTAVGIGLATGLPVHAVVGDLTFLHDLNGLVIGPQEPRPDLRVLVASDDGGSIFATLEHGRPDLADVYERLFGTPHRADLVQLVRGLGLPATRIDDEAALAAVLRSPPSGIEVVEVPVDRARRRELDQAITALAATI